MTHKPEKIDLTIKSVHKVLILDLPIKIKLSRKLSKQQNLRKKAIITNKTPFIRQTLAKFYNSLNIKNKFQKLSSSVLINNSKSSTNIEIIYEKLKIIIFEESIYYKNGNYQSMVELLNLLPEL